MSPLSLEGFLRFPDILGLRQRMMLHTDDSGTRLFLPSCRPDDTPATPDYYVWEFRMFFFFSLVLSTL